jgi:hypothetical protein
MAQINSAEDYDRLLEKYADRLKLARKKYDEFKLELAVLDRALSVPAPADISEVERGSYNFIVKSARSTIADVERFCEYLDDDFDRWAQTIKRFK